MSDSVAELPWPRRTGNRSRSFTSIVAALAAAISATIAAWHGVLMKRSERKRNQPIVIVYERGDPHRNEYGDVVFDVSLANEGVGPAFGVRFGARRGRRAQATCRVHFAQAASCPRAVARTRS